MKGEIEFENVWFAYEDEEWVLKDVSFHVKPGETVALVGHTGAGKTSIINLINRFYDIQKGTIRIDGRDIRKLKRSDLRRHIGIVLQDVFLFTGDVEGNITLDNDDIPPAPGAGGGPDGQCGPVHPAPARRLQGAGHGAGRELLRGQRQLLAFARALAYDPAILVLDEATANIDTETEQLIQESLKQLIKNRTTHHHRAPAVHHPARGQDHRAAQGRDSGDGHAPGAAGRSGACTAGCISCSTRSSCWPTARPAAPAWRRPARRRWRGRHGGRRRRAVRREGAPAYPGSCSRLRSSASHDSSAHLMRTGNLDTPCSATESPRGPARLFVAVHHALEALHHVLGLGHGLALHRLGHHGRRRLADGAALAAEAGVLDDAVLHRADPK